MQNPFTTTFSKTPENSYIETDEMNEIIENFSYDNPSESVYKITGVRGSGKTVILSKIEELLRNNNDWVVYNLTTSRNLLEQLAALLVKDKYLKIPNKEIKVGVSANVLGNGGSFDFSKIKGNSFKDIGVEIEEGIKNLKNKKKKLLIGIDEVYKCKEMIAFASEFSKWLISGYPVYLVCTGLFDNINQLSNVKNLTFLKRATTIKTKPLNTIKMTEMYKIRLDINHNEAFKLANITKGYAYAFQKLGVLYFRKNNEEKIEDLINSLKADLFSYSYQKIWDELTDNERFFIKIIIKNSKRSDILDKLGDKAMNYSVYRDRLIKKGLVNSEEGCLDLVLPYFSDYIKEYC